MLRDGDVHNTPPVVREHNDEQQPDRRRRYDEEIRGMIWSM
jgi:hypothetical protein